MNTEVIAQQHMENNAGHEERLQRLDKNQIEIISRLGTMDSKVEVQSTKIDMILEKIAAMPQAGTSQMCNVHKENLDDFKIKTDRINTEIDMIKSRTNLIIGGLILLSALGPMVTSYISKCPEASRISRIEANQVRVMDAVARLEASHMKP